MDSARSALYDTRGGTAVCPDLFLTWREALTRPSSRTDDSTVFLGDGSLAGAPAPKLNQRGIRSVIKVVDDKCL